MADPSSPLSRFQLWRTMLPPALRLLLTLNVATYVVFVVLSIVGQGGVMRWLALPPTLAGLAAQPWSALTWGVTNIEAGLFGLIFVVFGMAWLSLLGRDIEEEGGPHRLLGLYVWATLGGTALALAAGGLLAGATADVGGVYAGAWGPLLGLLCYTAVRHPDRPIGLFLIGLVALKWVAIVLVVLELAFSKDPSHLGAALAGALVGVAEGRGLDLTGWARPLFGRRSPSGRETSGRASAGASGRRPAAASSAPRTAGRPGRSAAPDIDTILDKINEQGMDSLTAEERRILQQGGRG